MRKGDTCVVDRVDGIVQAVTPAGVLVQFPDGKKATVTATTPMYKDPENVMGRPIRHRKQRTLFAFSPAKTKAKNDAKRDPLGLSLVGKTFVSSPGGSDKEYTILRTGDPRLYMKKGSKIPVPILEHVESSQIKAKDREVKQSTVKETRRWVKSFDQHLQAAKIPGDDSTKDAESVILPLLKMGPLQLQRARKGPAFSSVVQQRRQQRGEGKVGAASAKLLPLRNLNPAKVTELKSVVPMGPLSTEETKRERDTAFRVLLSKVAQRRKVKRFKRNDIIQILKGKTRKRHLKFTIDIPTDYKDCHRKGVPEAEQQKWRIEELEEISTLVTDLKLIEKGYNIHELRKTIPDLKPIPGMWVYDAHAPGVKLTDRRARWVANGAKDPAKGKHDSHSPVGQLVTARVIMALITELEMDLVLLDIGKAFWKGRLNRKAVYMWAAEALLSKGKFGKSWDPSKVWTTRGKRSTRR